MRIVVENAPADVARNRAIGELDWALRDLTANLLRIMRGQGVPTEIEEQAQALVSALSHYRHAVGVAPTAEDLAHGLDADQARTVPEQASTERIAEVRAEEAIIRGAIDIAAARLLIEAQHEAAGHAQMRAGLNALLAIHKARRKRRTAARRAKRAALAARKGTPAPAR